MLKIRKFAAIDIGSNAVRLLISTITEVKNQEPNFKKTSLVRVPIRLGADVFVNGKISKVNIARMQDTMQAFMLLMKSHRIERFKACATSAMRDASNGKQLTKIIYEKTGLQIEIIDGQDEASIIAATDLHSLVQSDKTYLYVDVGGGSSEFTLFSKGKSLTSTSFALGTVRLLNGEANKQEWNAAENWIRNIALEFPAIELIGSGGNINNIFKSSGKKPGKPLSYLYLSSYYKLLTSLTYEERIINLNLNVDRADVIVPATKIYLSAMKWSGARNIFVPKIGLADGIVKSLYNEYVLQEIN